MHGGRDDEVSVRGAKAGGLVFQDFEFRVQGRGMIGGWEAHFFAWLLDEWSRRSVVDVMFEDYRYK